MTKPYNYALNLLGARAYTVRNLRRKLTQKGFDPKESDEAIERLLEKGYLDDVKFASEFARQRLVGGGASIRRVEQQLAQRGIARDVAKVAAALVVEEEGVDPTATMEKIATKKVASMGDLDPLIKRRRLFGFLVRKGYELDDVNRVVRRIFP
jgi:regulatory protein